MGTIFEFICTGCGYSAEVSGGADVGWKVRTQTMICLGCCELVDVATGPSLSLQPPAEKRRRCPRCRSRRFEPWGRADGPEMNCLSAQSALEVGAEGRFDCPKC